MTEKTLAIIKPDAVKKRIVGKIIQRIEDEGFAIARLKLVNLTLEEAKGFYAVHKEKKFFASLTEFMSSGPCRRHGPRGRERHRALAGGHGGDGPGPGRDGNAPADVRVLDRAQRRPRLGRPRDGRVGDQVLLQGLAGGETAGSPHAS